jgi:hypothetical protein
MLIGSVGGRLFFFCVLAVGGMYKYKIALCNSFDKKKIKRKRKKGSNFFRTFIC